MDIFIQLVINGLLLGGAYTIISLGLTLIFGVVRVVNFAHGEFLMVGMYLVYLIAAQFGVHPLPGPVAVILFALGALTQKGIIQPLLNADQHIQIFATVGVSTILLNLALVLFGANVLRAPVQLGTSAIDGQLLDGERPDHHLRGRHQPGGAAAPVHAPHLPGPGAARRGPAPLRRHADGREREQRLRHRVRPGHGSSASPPACWRRSTRCSRPWARTSC